MPTLIAYGVRIYPWTVIAESTKIPTITPGGLIPAASLKIAPGGSKGVKTPLLNRKECETPAVSVYSPTLSPSALAPPVNVKTAPGKSIVLNVPWSSLYP